MKMRFTITALALGVASVSAIECIIPGFQQTAYWFNKQGQSCSWTGNIGANVGVNDVGSE